MRLPEEPDNPPQINIVPMIDVINLPPPKVERSRNLRWQTISPQIP